jgi:hypothetical protein
VVPGCGCEDTPIKRFVLRRFSEITIPVRFRTPNRYRGHVVSHIRFLCTYRGALSAKDGSVAYDLS